MFWKFGFTSASGLTAKLEKEETTLSEILDDEDVIQECKGQNAKLIDYLLKEENLQRLIELVTTEPPSSSDEATRFKHAHIASELLTSDVWRIIDALLLPENMDRLFAILENKPPLNPLTASFFVKVVNSIIVKKPEGTSYIQERPPILDKIIIHLATPAIMDLLLKISTCNPLINEWLVAQKIVHRLVALFDPTLAIAEDFLSNVAVYFEDLVAFARKDCIDLQEFAVEHPLYTILQSEEVAGRLADSIVGGYAPALSAAIRIFVCIINPPVRGDEDAPLSILDLQRHGAEVQNILGVLTPRLEKLTSLLNIAPPAVSTSSGPLSRPLGVTRLRIVRVVRALIDTANTSFHSQIASSGAFAVCFNLFFELPENNLLHNDCLAMVQSIVAASKGETPSPLFPYLFQECKLVERLVDTWYTSPHPSSSSSSSSTRHAPPPRGLNGHVIQLAGVLASLNGSPLDPLSLYYNSADKEEIRQKWIEFSTNPLAERTALHAKILGGEKPLPPKHSDSDEDGSFFGHGGSPTQQDPSLATAEALFTSYWSNGVSSFIPDDFPQFEENNQDSPLVDAYGAENLFSTIGPQLKLSTPNIDVYIPAFAINDGGQIPDKEISDRWAGLVLDEHGGEDEDELASSKGSSSKASSKPKKSRRRGSDSEEEEEDSDEDDEDEEDDEEIEADREEEDSVEQKSLDEEDGYIQIKGDAAKDELGSGNKDSTPKKKKGAIIISSSDGSDEENSDDSTEREGSYDVNPENDPFAPQTIALSPRSTQAVSRMPEADPFLSPNKSSPRSQTQPQTQPQETHEPSAPSLTLDVEDEGPRAMDLESPLHEPDKRSTSPPKRRSLPPVPGKEVSPTKKSFSHSSESSDA